MLRDPSKHVKIPIRMTGAELREQKPNVHREDEIKIPDSLRPGSPLMTFIVFWLLLGGVFGFVFLLDFLMRKILE